MHPTPACIGMNYAALPREKDAARHGGRSEDANWGLIFEGPISDPIFASSFFLHFLLRFFRIQFWFLGWVLHPDSCTPVSPKLK